MTSSPPSSSFVSFSFEDELPLFLFVGLLAIVLDMLFAAFCAAENTDAKKPPGFWGADAVPPGVLTSSGCGVSGAIVE
jgi:hypothetical protein